MSQVDGEAPLKRRSLFRGLAMLAGCLATSPDLMAAPRETARVVYHLSDLDRVMFALGNIDHHFEGAGGADRVSIALVVLGPALTAFHRASARADIAEKVSRLRQAGLTLHACANSMKAQKVQIDDLLDGFVSAPRGGVVLLAELQSGGYAYIRP